MPPEVKQRAAELDICTSCLRRLAHRIAQEDASESIREVRAAVWRQYGGGGRMKLTYRRAFEEGDMTSIPRFDECTADIQLEFPWIRDAEHLFEILRAPVQDMTPQPRHWDEALRQLTPSGATSECWAWF